MEDFVKRTDVQRTVLFEELSQKVSRGLELNAEKGFINGGIAPFGYKLVDKKLEIDEKHCTVC